MRKLPVHFLAIVLCLLLTAAFAQNKYEVAQGFVAHEWGTFTTLQRSDGRLLSGLELEEERLPAFVQNICFCYLLQRNDIQKGIDKKSRELKNVTIKMETPVLYFYSNETAAKSITVDVKFSGGSISQWFPARSSGELSQVGNFYYPSFTIPPPLSFQLIDFVIPKTGYIQWKAEILPKQQNPAYTSNPKQETPQWLAPRATASNLIKIKKENGILFNSNTNGYEHHDQIEKFLFYRGIGNFAPSLKVEFNANHNLVLTNLSTENMSYVMVYEKTDDGKKRIWWSGKISGQWRKVIEEKSDKFINVTDEMEKFVKKLVAAGLYEDEARAMLKTWEGSYFEHSGLKVFWIVPPGFTDNVLPLNINPKPDITKRVLIGRSEILTPEFEASLNNLSDTTLERIYKNDRFLLAYKESNVTSPKLWTDYNVLTNDEKEDETGIKEEIAVEGIEIFPNPVSGNLIIKILKDKTDASHISIFNTQGEMIKSFDGIQGDNLLDTGGWPAGTYFLNATFESGKKISKQIIKQ